MKKNIVLMVLTLITASSVTYGIIQKSEAEKQREISISLQEKLEAVVAQAQQMQQEAERQREIAITNAMMAEEARALARERKN